MNEWGCLAVIIYCVVGFIVFSIALMMLPYILWILIGYLVCKYIFSSNKSDI